MTKWIKNILIIIVLLVALLFVLRKTNILPSFKNIFSSKAVIIDNTPILIQQVKQLSELITITVFDEVVMDSIKYSEPDIVTKLLQFTVPGTTPVSYAKLVLIAKGKVIAGTDLQKLTEKNIFLDKDSVAFTMPKAEILDAIINPSDITTFSETGKWSPEEITQVKGRIKAKLIERAMEQDVINKANKQAIAIMENFLRTIGFKKVTVKVES